MKRDGHDNVNWFLGPEVETTPALGKKTLFVVGYQDTAKVEELAREHKTPHIFLGANHSFKVFPIPTKEFIKQWDSQITHLLDKGFMVTLDYQAHHHEIVLKILNAGIWQCRNFIPLLSVRIPKIQNSSLNLTVKFDDIDFNATNPGVWCMNFREVTDSNRFTDWKEYTNDVVISDREIVLKVEETIEIQHSVTKESDKSSVVKNDSTIGLDPDAKSKLKPEPENEKVKEKITKKKASTDEVLEAYAEGTTDDSLGKEMPKKIKVAKVAE